MKKSVRFPKTWEKCILLMGWVLLAYAAHAQTGSVVRGIVTDSDGESIPGVNVLVKGTSV